MEKAKLNTPMTFGSIRKATKEETQMVAKTEDVTHETTEATPKAAEMKFKFEKDDLVFYQGDVCKITEIIPSGLDVYTVRNAYEEVDLIPPSQIKPIPITLKTMSLFGRRISMSGESFYDIRENELGSIGDASASVDIPLNLDECDNPRLSVDYLGRMRDGCEISRVNLRKDIPNDVEWFYLGDFHYIHEIQHILRGLGQEDFVNKIKF